MEEKSSSAEQNSVSGKKPAASPFDNLSRDDLVKKCRGLLGIAQKAKQAKDECQEEIKQLREQLAHAETQKIADKDCLKAMQEMVDSLTEQKLNATIRVDELKKVVASSMRELEGAALIREQLEKLSNENEAFKRQIQRLTDENEELLGNLSTMEDRLKSLATNNQQVEQEKSILEVELSKLKNETVSSEKEKKLIRKLKLYKNKVQEISAKILLLKSDRKILMKTVKEYSEQVPKWQKELLNASNVLFARTQALEKEAHCLRDQCTKYSEQIGELSKQNEAVIGERDDLKMMISALTEQCSHTDRVSNENRRLVEEVKALQVQVSDVTDNFKHEQVKNVEQRDILEDQKQQIEKLSSELIYVREQLLECDAKLHKLETENADLLQQSTAEDIQRRNEAIQVNEYLQKEKNDLEQRLLLELEEKNGLRKNFAELQQTAKDWQNLTEKLETELANKEAALEKLTYDKEQLKSDVDRSLEDVQKRVQELEQIKTNLELEKEELFRQNEEYKNNVAPEEVQECCRRQLQELEMKNAQVSEFEQKLLRECQENEKVRACLEDLQNEYNDIQRYYQRQAEELEANRSLLAQLEQKLHLVETNNEQLKDATANDRHQHVIDLEDQLRSQVEALDLKNKQVMELEQNIDALTTTVENLRSELQKSKSVNQSLQINVSEYETKFAESLDKQEMLETKLLDSRNAFEALESRYNVAIVENQQLKASQEQLYQDSANDREELGTVRSKYELVKMENSELLSELKEINEILKERGGVISLQLSKISELESQKAALQQKLNELDSPDVEQLRMRLQELERSVSEKEAEINAYRDRDRSFDAQSDAMSTSTISRAEECARMREIDDSFEEKYNKLRSLAVRLKKKVAEQTVLLQKYEKEKEPVTLGKNLQSLQAEYDKLLDELEAERKGKEQSEVELGTLSEQLDKQRQELDALNHIRSEIDSGKKDKSSLESTIREYREQLQSLKREKEAFNLAKKEIDAENQKLKTALKAKEKQLNDELEAQKELKAEVERSRMIVKKANVLNLEMEAYEKSLGELNKKLETKKAQVRDLEGTVEAQDGTIKSLKSQIGLLEQSLTSERTHAQELKKNVDLQQEKLRLSEHQRGETNVELAQLKVEYERIKLEMESNRAELADAVTEKEKISSVLEMEKSKLLKQVYSVENESAELKAKIKEKEQEIEDVRTEFASYKIRAQSVLKQNQNKDSGKERELEDEVQNLQKSLELSQSKLANITQQTTELNKINEELKEDKARLHSRCKELRELLEESRLQNDSLLNENRNNNLTHQEALRTQRLQTETLVNCYKKQLEELQEKYSKDMENLQSQIGKSYQDSPDASDSRNNNASHANTGTLHRGQQHISDEQKISLLLMEREDGEGSESTSSQSASTLQQNRKISISSQNTRTRASRDLIPLDELLNSSFDDTSVFDGTENSGVRAASPTVELQHTKEKLSKQESRVRHLTALLAEAEQDLAKLTQLNELLKEEVRRQERSIEREKHVHNSEYLKNVIFKFLTLSSGDEKSHLVPVLNTILKLSPEETQKLNHVAKGVEGGGRGWTGILWK
ncbi:GRIP and coiled-coil domain-containing protein 2 isoform X2 [Topomyia yanbarensis]|uniref:GRIP and coiled-coil domain-containing protein 2 isoform X2 n=1 Tax=Topomyia yanbarensis TaxID=2498891 RepID=UPI00273C1186|nr:GRIP and coiled-coil domain-containing protein 2 isoform X2 [Topomyia yanbarensis]